MILIYQIAHELHFPKVFSQKIRNFGKNKHKTFQKIPWTMSQKFRLFFEIFFFEMNLGCYFGKLESSINSQANTHHSMEHI